VADGAAVGAELCRGAGIEIRYAAREKSKRRFAILYQERRRGKDYLRGVKEASGADADKRSRMATSFEVADPTSIRRSHAPNTKADVFLIYSVTPPPARRRPQGRTMACSGAHSTSAAADIRLCMRCSALAEPWPAAQGARVTL